MEQVLSVITVPYGHALHLGQKFREFGQHIADHFIPHARNNYHPHIFGHRAMALFSMLLICAKVCALAVVIVGPIVPAYSSAITTENIVSLTNTSRESYGLADLQENSMLDVAAQNKANDMLAKGYFAHNTPDGKTPWDFITAAGYNYITAGENLAVNFTEAESVETAWMNSPEHKANILNKNFEDIGIGVSQGEFEGHVAIFVVQEFGTLAAGDEKITLNNAPTTVEPKTAPAPQAPKPRPTPVASVRAAAPASQATAAPVPAVLPTSTVVPGSETLSVTNGAVTLSGDQVVISAQASAVAVKVMAYFGDKAVLLSPKENGQWQGQIAASDIASGDNSVYVRAFDMAGNSTDLHLADFSPTVVSNFNVVNSGSTPASFVNFYGHLIDPKSAEQRFYLLFIAAILTCLIIAIASYRHMRHLPVIANASFVAILAALLFMVH